jgi:hypothetical protein
VTSIRSETLRIGSGSGWWGDRIEPAHANAEYGHLDYLCFETMAEATVSTAQVRARRDPSFPGYDTYLEDRMRAVLPACLREGTKIVSNQGWINPARAAQRIAELIGECGHRGVTVAAVSGGQLDARVFGLATTILESGAPVESLRDSLVSAEVYLGADSLVQALAAGASVVVSGRVADPSLFVAPAAYEFGWDLEDPVRVGRATVMGHLMECGAQVTGGYFLDPGVKDVPDPWNLALPIAEVADDGTAVITKLDGTGGVVDLRTVKEQLLYEVHDPTAYLTPDVTADFTTTHLYQDGPDRVRFTNGGGRPRPQTLKVSLGCVEGFIGEDMFFYAGPGADGRAEAAAEILRRRFEIIGLDAEEVRIDFLGQNAVHGGLHTSGTVSYEVAVRVAARTRSASEAAKVGREVDGMAVSGVGMTGKRVPHQERVREVIGVWSTLVPRDAVEPVISFYES